MTRRFKQANVRSESTKVKTLKQLPLKYAPTLFPLNHDEAKEDFLKTGKIPNFELKGTNEEVENFYSSARNHIRFELFGEAEHILNKVKEEYGEHQKFVEDQYGLKISKEDATKKLIQYLKENKLEGCMDIVWCKDMVSSGRMQYIGPKPSVNKPEARAFTMWIKNTEDNPFLRENGIRCLANHEIGTHFMRFFNDGLQPWYTDRDRFGIRGTQALEVLRTEEGLASLNTLLQAGVKYLWSPALLYYTACKAADMTFKQLFEHLTIYICDPEQRWRYCMRVKRGLSDSNDIGGSGKEQCYFEGAVYILRNVDKIDFTVLMSGKVCVDEIQRIKRIARLDCIRLPTFMRKEERYKKILREIAVINEVHLNHPKYIPPKVYMQRIQKGQFLGKGHSPTKTDNSQGSRKVRRKAKRKKRVSTVIPISKDSHSVQGKVIRKGSIKKRYDSNDCKSETLEKGFDPKRSISDIDRELLEVCLSPHKTVPAELRFLEDRRVGLGKSPPISYSSLGNEKESELASNLEPVFNNCVPFSPRKNPYSPDPELFNTPLSPRYDVQLALNGLVSPLPRRPFRLSRLKPLIENSPFLTKLETDVSKFFSADPHVSLSSEELRLMLNPQKNY